MTHPVILFDGACNLCDRVVATVVKRDPRGTFRFAPLQSAAAQRILREAGAVPPTPGQPLDTLMLVDGDQVLVRSDAALRIARGLRFPWPMLALCRLVPRRWRDSVYRYVASRRYDWFGRRDACLKPTAQLLARFVPGANSPATSSSR
ncbi:MAG: DUF393 domain-containing protein [Phycisphaerae bacterium]|nr:DUF393 domain-containing protein [Phycisphaerae bacterium]